MQGKKQKYTIGELARLTGISITALRYYDREQVLIPAIRNESNGYRYYSVHQLERAQTIRDLKSLGLSLEEIREILKKKSHRQLEECLREKVREIEGEIENLESKLLSAQNAYRRVTNGRSFLDVEADTSLFSVEHFYPVEVAPLKEMWVLYTRYPSEVNAENLFSDRCLELQRLRSQYNLYTIGPYIGIFHDGYERQFSEEKGDLEVCLPVIKPDGFQCRELRQFGGFLTASTIHIGPYSKSRKTYQYLEEWIGDNGYEITGPPLEYYLMDISNTFSEEQYLTKIHFPVKKRENL
ncbi:MerR family transcriptional regulator [Lachnospiraceae bacterium KGMB03038]|nr:MerR family transcriptional regulator [Lachnospiraceae bacterium KGMB03038]